MYACMYIHACGDDAVMDICMLVYVSVCGRVVQVVESI